MRFVIHQVLLAVAVLTSYACHPGRPDSNDATLKSLIEAERAFANTSITFGTRKAFLDFFATEGVVFDSGPVNAHHVWRQRPAEGATLMWDPEIAAVSSSADLGYTSGPYQVSDDPDSSPFAWGHFVSVWRRDESGNWKVVADGGVEHQGVPVSVGQTVADLGTAVSEWPLALDTASALSSLLTRDDAYSRTAAGSGLAHAVGLFAEDETRFYRPGSLPIVGFDAAATVLQTSWIGWERRGSGIALSGDLGYTYGVLERAPRDDHSEAGRFASYYRIWKRRASSAWCVVVDVVMPFPAGT